MQPPARLESPAILAGKLRRALPGNGNRRLGALGGGGGKLRGFGPRRLGFGNGGTGARFGGIGAGAFLRHPSFQAVHPGAQPVELSLHRGQLIGNAGLVRGRGLCGGYPAGGQRKGKGGGLKDLAHGKCLSLLRSGQDCYDLWSLLGLQDDTILTVAVALPLRHGAGLRQQLIALQLRASDAAPPQLEQTLSSEHEQ